MGSDRSLLNPTQRFSNRVENYVKYRPKYPPAIVSLMHADMDLTRDSVIADVGSGTGFLSGLFLDHGNVVFSVEPNREMRTAAQRLLAHRPGFRSIDGTAEATTLASHSVDFVTAGQAFHWFDAEQARSEFARILRPGGFCIFVWNWRQIDASPFVRDYEALLNRFSDEYEHLLKKIDAIEADLRTFFRPGGYQRRSFHIVQEFDFEGLRGRLLSASYAPTVGHPDYEPMIAALRAVFDRYQVEGRVRVDYDTLVYYGRLEPAG